MNPTITPVAHETALPVPAVSIVVVCYNHADYIDECLESCVRQQATFPDMEIVVADDGSRDETPAIIRRWAESHPGLIVPVLAERNRGIAANFNAGLGAARGRLIAWLGGDDILLDDKLSRQVPFLERHPAASGCYHDAEVFEWPSGKTLGLFSALYAGRAAVAEAVDAKRMLDPAYQMLPSTLLVRRECMPEAFDTRLRFHNDYLFDLETLIKGGPFVRMEGVFTRYRKHEKSIGVDPKTVATMLEENLVVIAILEARYPGLARSLNRRAGYYITLAALRARKGGDIPRQRALLAALRERGMVVRATGLYLFGGLLARLLEPGKREFAVKLRSLFR